MSSKKGSGREMAKKGSSREISSKKASGPSGEGKRLLVRLVRVGVRLHIDNLVGKRTTIVAPVTATIREIKESLVLKHGGNPEQQILVRCGGGGDSKEYIRLEERSTVEECGLANDTRLLLLPAMRSGPITEELPSGSVRLFVEGDKRVEEAIDRMLKACGKSRKPDHLYALAQLDSQKPCNFTILEVPMPAEAVAFSKSMSDSSDLERKHPSKHVLSSVDQKQNVQTQSKMKQLRERMDKRKKKKMPTTPVAKTETPCATCGIASLGVGCEKCDQVHCAEHAKGHVCQPRRNRDQICRQQ